MLWSGARSRWPDLITGWNARGLRWREWGMAEMLWMIHHRNIADIAGGPKTKMRRYLQAAGDNVMLTAWDQQQMGDTFSDNDEQSNRKR